MSIKTRLMIIELIKSIKRNIRCITVESIMYEGNDVTDINFSCDLHDIPTLRREMYYFYGSQYIENTPDVEAQGLYTAFEYQIFGGDNIILHFNLKEIEPQDDDRNEDEPFQNIPDWI